tara:strand:- start:66 stop:218 length:153 start_codon:yes stop_codon:yes gene_type:complete
MEINLKLTLEEVSGILQMLGELPTKSNAYPLLINIKGQAEAQIPKEPTSE